MPSKPTGQLPGDFLRDAWFRAMESEATRRGWAISNGGPVRNRKDNTTFTLDTSPTASTVPDSADARKDVFHIARGLIHASTSWRGWGISLRHLADLERNFQRYGERYAVVLLHRVHDYGVVLYRRDFLPWTQGAPADGQLEITREELEGLTWFDSTSSCASFLGQSTPPPGGLTLGSRRAQTPPPRPSDHHLTPDQVHLGQFCPHGQLLLGRSSEGGLRAAADGCWLARIHPAASELRESGV